MIGSAMRAARRVLLFAGFPALGAFSPLLVLPALTHALGAAGWASLAVAQASGAFGALFVNWAWNVEGPSLVSSAAPEDRPQLYAESMRGRVLAAAIALPIAALIAFAVAPAYRGSAAIMAIAVSLAGLLPSWYFIGTGAPVRLACFDAVPRIGTAAVSAGLLLLAPNDWIYPVVLLIATAISVAIGARTLSGKVVHIPAWNDAHSARRRLLLMFSGLVSSGYTTLTIPIVAIVSPAAIPLFAAASRFQGYGTLGLSAVTNSSQAWVSQHGVDLPELRRRRRLALAGNSAIGLLVGGLLAILLPEATHFLFSGTVDLGLGPAALVGGIVFMLAVSMSTTFHVLIPAGHTRVVAVSGLITSAIGIPLLIALTAWTGATGALVAILMAETTSATIQLAAYFGREPIANFARRSKVSNPSTAPRAELVRATR